jgi:hypothetical protein
MAKRYRPIGIGTICITRGSKVPIVNDGLLVVVTAIRPASQGGLRAPYPLQIQRVDGQPLGLVGKEWFKHQKAWIQGWRLIPIDPDGTNDSITTAKPQTAPAKEVA